MPVWRRTRLVPQIFDILIPAVSNNHLRIDQYNDRRVLRGIDGDWWGRRLPSTAWRGSKENRNANSPCIRPPRIAREMRIDILRKFLSPLELWMAHNVDQQPRLILVRGYCFLTHLAQSKMKRNLETKAA